MVDDEIPDRVVVTALEFAVGIAAAGAKLRPPLPFPVELRPFLKFQKLPSKALRDVRAAVEGDVVFRERIAGVAVADLVDEAGMLWLRRPEGWQARLTELAAAGGDDPGDASAELRRAERRREAAEAATRRALAEVAALRADLARRADHHGATASETEQLRRERDAARADSAAHQAEARRARARLAEATSQVAGLRSELAATQQRADHAERTRDEVLAARAAGDAPTEPTGPVALAGAAQAAAALAAQSGTAAELARELEHLARTIAALAPAPARAPDVVPPRADRPRPGTKRSQRTPIALPGGVYGTSAAATEHLLRTPRAAVFVDGYNVAKLRWPRLALDEQRERCIETAEDVARRYGTNVTVVFDGADVPGAAAARRRLVRVRFSSEGVTADDAIREEVAGLSADVPVVVVTNDQAVVADVRAHGANPVTSDAWLEVASR
jgi:predicted RNA-binding protein with PIN domain